MFKFKYNRTKFPENTVYTGEVVCMTRADFLSVLKKWNNMPPYQYLYAPLKESEPVDPNEYDTCSYGLTYIKRWGGL